jgi:hypothetical protein
MGGKYRRQIMERDEALFGRSAMHYRRIVAIGDYAGWIRNLEMGGLIASTILALLSEQTKDQEALKAGRLRRSGRRVPWSRNVQGTLLQSGLPVGCLVPEHVARVWIRWVIAMCGVPIHIGDHRGCSLN